MKRVKVSNNVIRRLPRYLRKLDELSESGVDKISSRQLGDLLGLTSSQVRQDFNCFGEFGQQGYGYNVAALRAQIAGIMGMERGFTAILVGVGNIGRAMMENFCFADWGVKLAAAFDIKPALIGTEFNGVHIYGMDELESYLAEHDTDIAVLTVPKTAAIPVTERLTKSGIDKISSRQLGDLLGLTSSQVRQDFNCFGEFGQQGYGYNVAALRAQIAGIMGMERGFTAILVGVGNIGRALMENFCFADWGVRLAAAFDIKPALIGTEYNGVHIYGMDELESYLAEHETDIAVLTVPKTAAIPVTERLTKSGIDAIWNFTNVELTEPNSSTIVENVHFSDSLLSLSYYVAERRDETAAKAAREEK